MPTTIALNTGAQVPTLAFGTGTSLKYTDVSLEISQAIDCGFRHLDCAAWYKNEDSVGQGIKRSGVPRSELFITTKAATNPDVRGSLEKSLKDLDLEYVDLYLIHSPIETPPKDAWPIMEELLREGKTKAIGVSNFRISEFESFLPAATIVPAVNQIEFNPYTYNASVPLLTYMSERDIKVEAYSPLAPLTKWLGKSAVFDALVEDIAKRKGVTTGVVLLAWSKQVGAVAVTTSSKKDRLLEQMVVQTMEPLSEEDLTAITTEGSKHHYRAFMLHMDE